jgi:phage terminase large subunit GpA-like protein
MALKDFESTGSQEKLKATVNTDQGRAYALMAQRGDGLDAITLKQRAESSSSGLIQREVPGDAHFVTTSVDVQKHRFVVQVQAWAPGRRTWIVDRFNLTHSDRIGEDGNRIKVSPFTHAEDWAVLDKLLADEYTISGTDLKVKTRLVVCDSGGGGESKYNNSTINAYAYATRLKRLGRADRFALLKGASTKKSPRIAKGKPGDDRIKVPLWVINPNTIKDEVHEALSRNEVGDGYVYLPEWLQEWFFRELTAETRTPNGWVKRRKADNNEAFDLCVYNLVAWSLLGGDRIDWAKPPSWCARPLGQSTSKGDKPEGNKNFLKYLRERSQRLNGE